VPWAGRYFALHAIGLILAAAPVRSQSVTPGALSEIPVPGGLAAAMASIDDRAAPDRSQFLLEFIRRTYDMPVVSKTDPRERARQSLLAQLAPPDRQDAGPAASRASGPTAGPPDRDSARAPETVPLPLTPAFWIDVVFGGHATADTLLASIAGSRDASLLYYGLLSLDEDTRAWLATQPGLVTMLVSRHSSAFAVAAPGLRVSSGSMRLPGGPGANPAWEALAGESAHDPVAFVRAVLDREDGSLPHFLGALAQLTPAQIRFALHLDAPDPAARTAAARRLYAAFEMVAWKVEQRAFWRPPLDPALLVADLKPDDEGRPILPGTQSFWAAILSATGPENADPQALIVGDPVDLGWLCAQIFKGTEVGEQRRRYNLVLFASRVLRRVSADIARDAATAVRAGLDFPALVATLERAKLDDVAAYAAAARRAALLARIRDAARSARAQAQFQGALSLLTRAALRGSLPVASFATHLSSLSAVDLGEGGEYEGRLVRWLSMFVDSTSSELSRTDGAMPDSPRHADDNAAFEGVKGDMDRAVLRLAAGAAVVPQRFVDWEGTRYRLDPAMAEANRLARLLGEHHPPYLTCARALAGVADALSDPGLTPEALRQQAAMLEHATEAIGEGRIGSGKLRHDELAAALGRAARAGDQRAAGRLAPALRAAADDLLARGLIDVTYAVAMGQPDRVAISAGDAARRHEFGSERDGDPRRGPWQFPASGAATVPGRGSRVVGSLLGLDVTLADFALIRLSSRPPSRAPTFNSEDRRVMTGAVALAEPARLTDADRDFVVALMGKGRRRLAAVRTKADAAAVADDIRLSPARRTVLPWIATHDLPRLAAFLSPIELLWLGLEERPVDARLDAWGAPAEPRLGCLCVQLLDRRPWETLAGRWNFGLLASGFADLNLRLAELLAELQMPASLLAPVLAAATIDFTENATSRDADDRRGPIEFVQALGADRVEQYLALLTTDGPLVPAGVAPESGAGAAIAKPGGSR
jgi:hypothetical protein